MNETLSAPHIPMELIKKKNIRVFLVSLWFLKKSLLKLLDCTVYIRCGFQNSLPIDNVCYEHTEMQKIPCGFSLFRTYQIKFTGT